MAVSHVYNQTVADGTATSVVRPSDWNSAHNQFVTVSGNTAGQSTFSGTNVVFQGGNNVTLSVATAAGAATIVMSGANTVAQTNQTQASGNIAGIGFTSTTTGGVVMVGTNDTNGLSVGVPNWITTYAAQTNQTVASGNIAGTGFTTTTAAGVVIAGTNDTSGLKLAVPAYITTYAAQTNQTVASGNIAGTGFTSTTTAGVVPTGTLNTAGLSLAVPNWITTYAAQSVQTQASGNIAGSGFTSAGANISLSGTLNSAGLSLSASVAAGGGGGFTGGVSTGGNTLGNTGTQTGSLIFVGGNNITLSVGTAAGGAQTITISGANAGGAQTGISGIIAGTQTQTSGTLSFVNSNGISFGMSNSSQITASYTVPTQSTQPVAVSGSNGSFTFSTLTLGALNGMTFYTSNGSVVGSYTVPTVPASYVSQVNGSSGAVSMAVGSSLSSSTNGSSITWGLASNITTALQSAGAYLTTAAQSSVSNVSGVLAATNNTGGGTATLSGNISFSNANNMTFYTSAGNAIVGSFSTSQSVQTQASGNIVGSGFTSAGANVSLSGTNNSAGLSLSVSVATPITTQAIYFVGNTTGQSSSSTVADQTISYSGAGIASMGWSAGQIIVSVPAGGGGGDGYNIVSMLTATSGGGTLGATFSTLSGSIGLMAGSNITLSQTSNTIVINGPAAGGGGGNTLSYWTNNPMTGTVSQTLGNSTSYLFPVFLPDAISASYIRFPVSMGVTSTSYQTTGNTAWSASRFSTWNVHLYSMMTGASSQSLGYIASGSAGFTEARTVSAAANSTQFSVGFSISYPITGGTSSYATSYGESSNSLNLSSQSYTLFTGERFLDIPFANSLSAGVYYMLYGISSTTSTSGVNSLSALNVSQSFMVATQVNNVAQLMGQVSASSVGHFLGLGSVSIAAGATTSSIALSQVSSSASQPIPYVQIIRRV